MLQAIYDHGNMVLLDITTNLEKKMEAKYEVWRINRKTGKPIRLVAKGLGRLRAHDRMIAECKKHPNQSFTVSETF